tara:strand:+ start:173 stop:358 length:186 start_codon:yes stop_codon:yes gene_type:complete
VIKSFKGQIRISIPFKFKKRRKSDVVASFCSPKKAIKELDWIANLDLKQAINNIKKITYIK